jgi:hypothetical protein
MNSVKYLAGHGNISNKPMPPFNDMACNFSEALSEKLIHDFRASQFPDIIAFAFWARRGNIQKLKDRYKEYSDRLGRGLVFHIAPSNIPVNFVFSFLFSLLAGNANIVRIPSKPFPQIPIICDTISELFAEFPGIGESSAFVNYPADDEITAAFGRMADARIIWGGDKTVKHIRGLEASPRCVDVVFPDRYSICMIDGKAIKQLSETELNRLAEGFYNDTYLMDQNACSSPQLVLWKNVGTGAKERFWDSVNMAAQGKYSLQAAVSVEKYLHLCSDAIKYNCISSFNRYENIIYRAIFSSLPDDLAEFRGQGGYFYEYDLKNFEELLPFINQKYQTITYFGIEPNALKEFIINNHLLGIDRIVPIGSAMDIGLTWDGYDLVNILTRTICVK